MDFHKCCLKINGSIMHMCSLLSFCITCKMWIKSWTQKIREENNKNQTKTFMFFLWHRLILCVSFNYLHGDLFHLEMWIFLSLFFPRFHNKQNPLVIHKLMDSKWLFNEFHLYRNLNSFEFSVEKYFLWNNCEWFVYH